MPQRGHGQFDSDQGHVFAIMVIFAHKTRRSRRLDMRLFAIMYSLAGPTLAGILIIAALTMNMFTANAMIASAVIGFIIALPVAWFIAKMIRENV
ncbi:hypothetical protein [Thioclava sp. L04-15]|nr:hypothetical protein [Thioclava sp. L04-15]TNE84786.1 MAG: hypothetical protein EP337_13620 [Paracoccaceae bacterium]